MDETQTSSTSTITESLLTSFREKVKQLPLYQEYQLNTSDKYLTRFLKIAKNDLPKAISRYETYNNVLVSLPKSKDFTEGSQSDRAWFIETLTFVDSESKKHFEWPSLGFYGKDKKGRAILGFEASATELFLETEHFLNSVLYAVVLTFDHILENYPYCMDTGFIFIDDWKAMSSKMSFFFMKNPTFLKNMSGFMSGAMPIKVKRYFILNAPKLFDVLFNFVKPFLSEKLKKRTNFAQDTEALKECIGPEAIPKFLGGTRDFIDLTKIMSEGDIEEQIARVFPRKWSTDV